MLQPSNSHARRRRVYHGLCAALAALTIAGPAAAQNGSSFLDVQRSTIDYTAGTTRPAVSCRSLLGLTGHDYSVISATMIDATADTPEHCRVYGVIPPEIRFGVHLPSGWNGRFYMQGNGGYAGNAPDAAGTLRTAMRAVAHGFAAASTDTGHDGRVEPLATFAHDNLQKEIDYAFRAVHLTAVTAKAVITAYYGTAAHHAVLGRLLDRGTPGPDVRTTVSRRLRRHRRRCAGAELHRYPDGLRLEQPGARAGAAERGEGGAGG